jgi:hypothetical protein
MDVNQDHAADDDMIIKLDSEADSSAVTKDDDDINEELHNEEEEANNEENEILPNAPEQEEGSSITNDDEPEKKGIVKKSSSSCCAGNFLDDTENANVLKFVTSSAMLDYMFETPNLCEKSEEDLTKSEDKEASEGFFTGVAGSAIGAVRSATSLAMDYIFENEADSLCDEGPQKKKCNKTPVDQDQMGLKTSDKLSSSAPSKDKNSCLKQPELNDEVSGGRN